MVNSIIILLPYLLSVMTIIMTIMAGNKSKHAWSLGLVNQILWFSWIVISHNWGLLPGNIALSIVYFRNNLLWRKQ